MFWFFLFLANALLAWANLSSGSSVPFAIGLVDLFVAGYALGTFIEGADRA